MNEEYIFAEDIDEEAAAIRRNQNARPENYGLVIVACIMGVISLVFFLFGINIFSSIVAIVLACIYLATSNSSKGRGLAITAIVTSVLSIVLCIGSWMLVFTNIDNLESLVDDIILYQYEDTPSDLFDELEDMDNLDMPELDLDIDDTL